MQKLTVNQTTPGVFLLSGELNRNNVSDCWPNRIQAIKQAVEKQPVIVDLGGLTHADTAGLAWLINLLRDCQTLQMPFNLRNVPQTLINLAKISDVDGFLPLQ